MSNWKLRERELAAKAEAARKGRVIHDSIRPVDNPEPPIDKLGEVIPCTPNRRSTKLYVGVTYRKPVRIAIPLSEPKEG